MIPASSTSMHNHASHHQSLRSSALELKYARSEHLVDVISKDEDIRRLRLDIHILEDDNDELRGLLQQEEDRSDQFERLVSENLARAEEAEAQLQHIKTQIQLRDQEALALQAEKLALLSASEDASTILADKLALTRKLSLLKPELEHLRTQAASTEALMSDKLSLQRQLSTIQCELENARREAQRALAKRRNTGVEIAQEEQVQDLRRQLSIEKCARQRAEDAAEISQGDSRSDELRKQLVKERKARKRAEDQLEAAGEAIQVEHVRAELMQERQAKADAEEALNSCRAELDRERKSAARVTKRADSDTEAVVQAEGLRQELGKEKKDRIRVEQEMQKALDDFEAQKAVLDDKLNQFRAKLRTTKEKLKNTESELAATRLVHAPEAPERTAAPRGATKAATKKRNAAQMDTDATTLGTPGDGAGVKRGRRIAAGVGDKSTFSITPFLNKTASAIDGEDDQESENDVEASPVAGKQQKAQPLKQQPPSKANIPPKKPTAAQKKQNGPALALITEEDESEKQTVAPQGATLKIKTKTTDGSRNPGDPVKKRSKIRKSLADFPNFIAEPDAEKKKKKRKLGGLGKTLFDEEEDAAPTTKPNFALRGLLAAKASAIKGGSNKSGAGSSFVSGGRTGSILLTAHDGSGFQFSPLKRPRKNLDDTLRLA